MFGSLSITASGLTAQRLRLDVIANNLANAESTRTAEGGPYQRQILILKPREEDGFGSLIRQAASGRSANHGVRAVKIDKDTSPFVNRYMPGHPDADDQGYVQYPNVNVVAEMVDMISASRAYEANAAAFSASRGMLVKALELGRR